MLTKPCGGFHGAHAVVAVDDNVLFRILKASGGEFSKFGQGDQLGTFNAADGPFIVFAAVDETEGAVAWTIEKVAHVIGTDFDREFGSHVGSGRWRGGSSGADDHRRSDGGVFEEDLGHVAGHADTAV